MKPTNSSASNYRRNKLRTIIEIVRRIENWPTAIALRLFRRRPGLRLLAFRQGINIACRRETRDWDVIHELFFAGSYRRAFQYLRKQSDTPSVLDIGGNIGLFSLLAASFHAKARVISFEPGPPNYNLFEINLLANPSLKDRIELRKKAVGGIARLTEWFFDQENPGGSGLFSKEGPRYPVEIVSFANLIRSMPEPAALVKIDIEGAEYEILRNTPAETWQRIRAISLELHDDPEQKMSQSEFLGRLESYGFQIEPEFVCSYFLSR
jgi:FkbM family methyltransferase